MPTNSPTSTEQVIEQVARENIPDDAIYAAMDAMQNVVIEDDEGEFPRLFDLLDYSGENKARTVTHGLASAAVYAAAPHVIRAAIEALARPPKPVDDEVAEQANWLRKHAHDLAWRGSSIFYDGGRSAAEKRLRVIADMLLALSRKTEPMVTDALTDARAAIASLDADALGIVRTHPSGDCDNGYAYPIRDELLAKIDRALSARKKGTDDA